SPIGDAAPVLLALDASLVLASTGGQRTVALADYFTGYRETVREGGEVIRAIRIPRPLAPRSAFYKMAKRRFDDISSVAVAIAVTLGDRPGDDGAPARGMPTGGMADDDGSPEGEYVTAARIGLGGVAATPIRARRTEQSLIGKRWSAQTLREAAALMAREGTPLDDHRASA